MLSALHLLILISSLSTLSLYGSFLWRKGCFLVIVLSLHVFGHQRACILNRIVVNTFRLRQSIVVALLKLILRFVINCLSTLVFAIAQFSVRTHCSQSITYRTVVCSFRLRTEYVFALRFGLFVSELTLFHVFLFYC